MAKQQELEAAIARTDRRLTGGEDMYRAQALAQTEERIVELESNLERLGRALVSATEAGEWTKVEGMVLEQDATQSELDALLAEWEGLAQVVA
jgi:hypothetical protein